MHDWQKTILSKTDTMKIAIKTLEDESFRIVMIVDSNRRLIGTVTDGDIRRALIQHVSMDAQLDEFMFKKPTVANPCDDKETILAKMKERNLLQIPIVDDNGVVLGLKTLQNLLNKSKNKTPVFIMAGGFGKRLRPLTESVPKPMLKVGKKPILEEILERFIKAGFYNFYISTHYKAEVVREHFGNGDDWNVSIQYIHEKEPLGTAGALGLLPDNLPEQPILVMNGDLLTKIDFEHLLNYHCEQGGSATMCVREYDFQVPYGVITAKENKVLSIVEKPIHRFFINAGIYVLNTSIIRRINTGGYLDMPQMLEDEISQGTEVNLFPIYESWLDIGRPEDYMKAKKDLLY